MRAHLDPPFKMHGSDVMLLISNYCLNSVNRAIVTVFHTIMSTLVECGNVVMHTGSQGFMEVVKLHKNCSDAADALKQTLSVHFNTPARSVFDCCCGKRKMIRIICSCFMLIVLLNLRKQFNRFLPLPPSLPPPPSHSATSYISHLHI